MKEASVQMEVLRVSNPCTSRSPPTPYFVEGVAPRDSGGDLKGLRDEGSALSTCQGLYLKFQRRFNF